MYQATGPENKWGPLFLLEVFGPCFEGLTFKNRGQGRDLGRYMDVSKNRKKPKMDGENNGKPYVQMDDLEAPLFLETLISHFLRSFFSRLRHNELFLLSSLTDGAIGCEIRGFRNDHPLARSSQRSFDITDEFRRYACLVILLTVRNKDGQLHFLSILSPPLLPLLVIPHHFEAPFVWLQKPMVFTRETQATLVVADASALLDCHEGADSAWGSTPQNKA